MQPYDTISILVIALVFLGSSAGLFALFKASLRQVTSYGVVRLRPGRGFFVLGVYCELSALCVAFVFGYGVLQLGPQGVRSDDLAGVWGLSAIVLLLLLIAGVLMLWGWFIAYTIRDLRKSHITRPQAVSAYSSLIMVVVLLLSTGVSWGIQARFGTGWYLLPLGVLTLVAVVSIQMVISRVIRRHHSPSR